MATRLTRPPALGRLRLSCVEDAPLLLDLINESMAKNFRIQCVADIITLIENCVLSICQLDINDVLIGCLMAKDYPLIPSVHPNAWEEYIWTKYKAIELKARNTLWIHLMCWNPAYSRDIVDNMLKSIFMHDPYVNHIAMIKSLVAFPLLVPGQSRSESSFRRIQAMERGVPGDQLPILFIADRVEVSPRLRIRRAVEEDNDDIVPIIERHSERLQQMYGEFYVSELISRHPESERVLLVCEHKELAVGVMCLNTQINYEALEESFELSPFAGLRRLDANFTRKDSDGSTVSFVPTVSDLMNVPESAVRVKDAKSKVTWGYDDDEPSDTFDKTREFGSPISIADDSADNEFDLVSLLEDDEDELEFDIVNIDTDLLRVPEMLTYNAIDGGLAHTILKKIDENTKHVAMDDKSCGKNNKIKKQSLSSSTSICRPPPEPRRYSGKPNAFLLELFAMHSDYDERYGFDMLEAAYELFPDRDYCVMCLPSSHPSFPLLEHFTLVTPFGSKMRFINETLYVAHTNSVRGDVSVRAAEAEDLHMLWDIVEHAPRAQPLLDLFEATLSSNTFSAYMLLSQQQPIGMVVLGPLEDGTAIRMQYDLEPEPRRPGTDATVLAGIMSPLLEPHGRWYMRELLRQSQYTTLFWLCRLFAKGDMSPSRNLMALATHMTPVHPRRSVPNITGNKDLEKIFQELSIPFALWVLERPLSSLPKAYVNHSIVVVGASRTGLAFLETLIMGPTSQYLTFTNITLVSEHGLPTLVESLKAANTCVPREGRYDDRYLKSIPFFFYVDIISAVMVQIDRKKKCIYLKGGGVKYYDELVLTCGHQFQHPEYLRESLDVVKELQKGKPCDRMLMDNPKYQPDKVPPPPDMPDNLMLINSLYDANYCMKKLMKMMSEDKDSARSLSETKTVVVYGECIEAYSCISALLELGLAANMITFIEPFPPEDSAALRVNCFNNEVVDERVQASINKLGINVLRQCYLSSWRTRDNRVNALNLMAPLHAVTVPCFAFFYYGLKAIDINAFKAINECGLVYDGGMVVGPAFETNDPHIFGAGPMVRYSRRLYAKRTAHRYYSSEDVGHALAKKFLRKLDPFLMANPKFDESDLLPRYNSSLLGFKGSHTDVPSATRITLGLQRRWQPVMKFESPILVSATLPGPLYYMKLRKPGPEIPMEVQLSLPHQGHTLVTDKRNNLFRLHLNALHCIEGVTCLSKKQFSVDVLSQLYGKHEAFFNKLLTRFQLGQIEDFYEFFMQPWMSAIYQETFDRLLRDINDQDVGTVYDLVKSKFTLIYEDVKHSTESSSSTGSSSCASIPSCGFGPKDAKNLGTFRSVIEKFVARTTSQIVTIQKAVDIPSECGQSARARAEALSFWRAVGGERIVSAHVARHLVRNCVTNPHYATINEEFI